MYLKSIDIAGYKSFALKTRVDLEPGITGVIGPNGCGKSNVMEAVRWCLGEMSWKSLRADSMVDVIFAGTAKRAPMSMSEVTLTFDNAASLLPVQYSEVVITRRLFRSGESQYFLNKTQCRLRDIREMFLDTGLGGDGYAIIDQGGVDMMIRAKPDERRAFFDEAAGVARYNAKREEALRKLDRVDMDLGRLQDSVALIDEQVKKLDSDARKAKLYAKYKEELAALEAAHVLEQAAAAEAELAGMQERAAPLEQLLGERRSQIAAEGAQSAALGLERAAEQNRLIEANNVLGDAKSALGRLEERLSASLGSVAAMDERAAACREESARDEKRRGDVAAARAKTAEDASRAEESLSAARSVSERAEAERAALQAAHDRAAAERGERAAAVAAAREESWRLSKQLSSFESDRSHAEVRARGALGSLERDAAGSREAEARLAAAREALSAAAAREEEAARASAAAHAAEEEARGLQERLGEEAVSLHAELAQSRARAESLEERGGQEPYWRGAQAVLSAGIPGLRGTLRSLFRCDDALKPWLEDLLGERLYAVVCEDSTAARAGVEWLSATGGGRARFLVLSALPAPAAREYPAAAQPVLSRLEFDPADEPVLRHVFAEAYSLDGMLFGDHWVYGGAEQKESAAAALADLPAVRARVEALGSRGQSLAAEREVAARALEEARAAVRRAADGHACASGDRRGLEASAAQLSSALETHRRNEALSEQEAARALADSAAAAEAALAARALQSAAQEREVAASDEEAKASEAVAAAREALANQRGQAEGLASRLASAAQELEAYRSQARRLDAEGAALAEEASRLEAELAALSARREEAAQAQARMRSEIEALGETLAGYETAAKAVFERLQELDAALAARAEALKRLQTEHDQAQADLHQHDLHAGTLRGRQDLLRSRLWDEWGLTMDEARAKHGGRPSDPEKIETLKRRISGMGNVNMAAPEEYEALAERQKFFSTQIADLQQAREDLKAAIQKINGATRENFRQTFHEVREHFRRLYAVLFEGGEADLILTDPENFLETGVEIMAQPPGKKLQSISLLSGGEKTLTAIALLFAFFMVKPSPFCMLDEADAALDDANIERFVALLREFQNKTQFLIVSHNKRTMEAADVIYGVTMEEKGVSQLVSVDFRKKKAPEAEPAMASPAQEGPFAA